MKTTWLMPPGYALAIRERKRSFIARCAMRCPMRSDYRWFAAAHRMATCLEIIPVLCHTAGSLCLLYRNRFLLQAIISVGSETTGVEMPLLVSTRKRCADRSSVSPHIPSEWRWPVMERANNCLNKGCVQCSTIWILRQATGSTPDAQTVAEPALVPDLTSSRRP